MVNRLKFRSPLATSVRLIVPCLVLAFSVLPLFAQGPRAESGTFKIGPGDQLTISVWRNEDLSISLPVRPDGFISLPLVNEVRAGGLTPTQLREVVANKLTEFVSDPIVSVMVSEVRSFKVSVLGRVRRPDRYVLDGPATVLDVIAMAGGFEEFSSPDDIRLLREVAGVYQRLRVNFSEATKNGGQNVNYQVSPGDIIVVP